MTPLRAPHVVFVVALAACCLLLTGCRPPAPAPSGSPSASATPTASPTPTSTPSGTPTVAPAASPACTREDLITTYTATDNTAGHAHGILTFTNRTAAACSMNGYPIVYFDHYEVAMPMGGVSSNDTSVAPTSVEVAPGGTAQAAITITQAGFVDGCDVVTTQALLVAPPITHPFEWSTDAQHVNTGDVSACSNDDISLITVGAITAG